MLSLFDAGPLHPVSTTMYYLENVRKEKEKAETKKENTTSSTIIKKKIDHKPWPAKTVYQ
jgi:hypothetical protein